MQPVRYREMPAIFSARQGALNEVLVFLGLRINDEGKVARGARADTLSEAARHANSLRAELRRRGVHAEVLRYCSQEILEGNPFHAALEATKSVPDRLRSMTGEHGDGARLIDTALALGQEGKPRVAINSLSTDSERDEQSGFATLCRGLLSMFRNPIAHDPRLSRSVGDDELLELLMVVSMIHRRLDESDCWDVDLIAGTTAWTMPRSAHSGCAAMVLTLWVQGVGSSRRNLAGIAVLLAPTGLPQPKFARFSRLTRVLSVS